MAAKKDYAYYIKGNKIAIIQKNTQAISGVAGTCSLSQYTTQSGCEDNGGTWTPIYSSSTEENGMYKSPFTTVTDGLEIQYTYSPTFNLQSTGTEGTDFHRFIGWGSDGTNLLLFTYGVDNYKDLSSLFAADDYIYIKGSGRWSGLHQVKSTGGVNGILTLKTKCNLRPAKISITSDISSSETLDGADTASDLDIESFKDLISSYDSRTTPYIFMLTSWEGLATEWESVAINWNNSFNGGIFSVTYNTTSGQIEFGNQITIDADGDYTSAAADMIALTSDSTTIYNMFYEQISVYEGIEVLSGESAETFELDISRYQADAIVYYLKAKLAEDDRNFERRAYFMREFKRQLEKGSGARKSGPHIVQGFKYGF